LATTSVGRLMVPNSRTSLIQKSSPSKEDWSVQSNTRSIALADL